MKKIISILIIGVLICTGCEKQEVQEESTSEIVVTEMLNIVGSTQANQKIVYQHMNYDNLTYYEIKFQDDKVSETNIYTLAKDKETYESQVEASKTSNVLIYQNDQYFIIGIKDDQPMEGNYQDIYNYVKVHSQLKMIENT